MFIIKAFYNIFYHIIINFNFNKLRNFKFLLAGRKINKKILHMKIQHEKSTKNIKKEFFNLNLRNKYEKLNHLCTIECMLIKFTEKKAWNSSHSHIWDTPTETGTSRQNIKFSKWMSHFSILTRNHFHYFVDVGMGHHISTHSK